MRQTVALEENVRVSVDGENISDPRFLERTYQEAMALVVEIAAYLKNAGKTPEISTDKKINMAYSVESMRMTSALMLVVSWLMVRLAENRGEISTEESMEDDKLLGAREICLAPPSDGADQLPEHFKVYQYRVRDLFERIARMEDHLLMRYKEGKNPVHHLLRHLGNRL
ncbi:MAG: hypothetical protein CMF31_03270 [Kordiimonas sp.]|nr:hypothetical protein [Kordiimonas sp.]|tara:strand:+ start:1667 stop:2173 length:507 start_codon:yes stop_codon:yes gene_type:complete